MTLDDIRGKMKHYRVSKPIICLIVVLFTLILAGCTAVEKVEPIDLMGRETKISTGTQGIVGQLAIGLMGTGKEDYVDAAGKTRHHLVAGLALAKAGNPPIEKSVAVSVGESVEFENYFIYIKEISGGGIALLPGASTGHVILIVVQPTTPLPRPTEIPAAHGPP